MAKLYFKYGAMGSSKTIQALVTKYNYEEQGKKVLLLKSATDNRDGIFTLRSRIGIEAEAVLITNETNVLTLVEINNPYVIIVDEAHFISEKHVKELRHIASNMNIPVICFGLRTDFRAQLFTGSKALFELADSISEIKSICKCGNKAIINARIIDGQVTTKGEKIFIGGNDSYTGMCWKCWQEAQNAIRSEEKQTAGIMDRTQGINRFYINTEKPTKCRVKLVS